MKPFEQQTYYELLEIPVTAAETEIRAAYARAIETYSPDSVAVYTLADPGQVDALRARLTEAMEILTDSDLRAEYDRMIGVKRPEPIAAVAPPPVPPAPPEQPAPLEFAAGISPTKVHAAFRSYALSYIPAAMPVSAPEAIAPPEPAPAAEPPPGVSSPPAAELAPVASAEPVAPAAEPVAPAAEPAPMAPVAAAPEPEAPVAAPAPEEPPRVAEPEPVAPAASPVKPVPIPAPAPPSSRRGSRPTPVPLPPRGASGMPGRPGARPGQSTGMRMGEAQQLAQESAIATAEAALAQVSAKAREPRPKPVELPPNTEFNGELLRRVRESRNITLAQLAERTRITSKHLENVEADRYTALPATVYLRGILMNIARELGLDPLRVSRSYLSLASEPKKK